MRENMFAMSSQLVQLLGGRKRTIGIIAGLVLASFVATGFVWAHKKINIVADGRSLSVSTLYSKPEDVLAQAGVTMGPRDEYRLSTTKLANGTTIAVYRAVPVTVTYQGKTDAVITAKPTVGEFAETLGLAKPGIKLNPPPETPVAPGLDIKAIALTESMTEKEVPIPHPVIRQPDATMEKGDEEVAQYGQDGTKIATIKLFFEDGQQVNSQIMAERVTVEPQPKIIKVGTRDTVETSRGTMRFRRAEWMEATAYLPTDGNGEGITATGLVARHGIVAVDPRFIPLGTRLYIPGYGLALAADTGGAIKGAKIDLCMEEASAAWRFGRRDIKVYVLE